MSREQLREILTYTKAVLSSMELSLKVPEGFILPYSGYRDYLRKSNELVVRVAKIVPLDAVVDHYDLEKIKGAHDTTTIQQKNMFEIAYTNLSILRGFLENKLGAHLDEIEALKLFLQANLRRMLFEVPEREVQVQNAIEQVLYTILVLSAMKQSSKAA